MKSLVAFLLGLIIGGLVMLYLPDQRREELNRTFHQQLDSLQGEIRELGEQMKHATVPKPEPGASAQPSPTAH
jgi:gas vesicle protein